MGAPAVVLTAPPQARTGSVRLLRQWHLLSLDAPTVAFFWLLLFAQCMHVPHALPAATALAAAVWIVYVVDRLLDARHEADTTARQELPQAALTRLYGEHARAFVVGVGAVGLITTVLLSVLPRALTEAWLSLAIPLGLYATAVHVLRLPARWKAVCVGIFFAVAVALPAAVHGGLRWPLALAALALGGVCRANCAVLRAPSLRLKVVLGLSGAAAVTPLWFGETRSIALACLAALGLLVLLVRYRTALCDRLGWLAWRALVDAALVAPALVVAVVALFAR